MLDNMSVFILRICANCVCYTVSVFILREGQKVLIRNKVERSY